MKCFFIMVSFNFRFHRFQIAETRKADISDHGSTGVCWSLASVGCYKRAPDDFSERVLHARAVRGDPLLGVRRAEFWLGGRRHAVHVLGAWADEHVRHVDRRTVLRTEALETRPPPKHLGDPPLH